jgi:DNA-binding transcriptional LysR family regulator
MKMREPAPGASQSERPKVRRKPRIGAQPARFYYKGNRLKQLRAFCYAVKFGTVARAADALFLSPSSVSLQLSALEKELGAHLLERTRPRLALTSEGQMLYDLARPLVEGIENLDQQFRAQRQNMDQGEVNIAAGASTIQYLLPPLVRDYRERFPDVRLRLSNVTGKDGLALLRSDQVDFAVGSMLDVPHDVSYEPVHCSTRCRYCRSITRFVAKADIPSKTCRRMA